MQVFDNRSTRQCLEAPPKLHTKITRKSKRENSVRKAANRLANLQARAGKGKK